MRRAIVAAALASAAFATPALAECHTGATVCVDHEVARVSVVVGDDGSVEVWRGPDSFVDTVFCLDERVVYAIDESESDLWYDCWRYEHRVL